MARKNLEPEDLVAIIDTREKLPLDLSPLKMERRDLKTGDYSVKGLEHIMTIERKSLPDLVGCVGRDRERFEYEMHRILAFPYKMVLVECEFGALFTKSWRGSLEPAHLTGSVLGWMRRGIPFLFIQDRTEAGKMAARFLYLCAKDRWNEAASLVQELKIAN